VFKKRYKFDSQSKKVSFAEKIGALRKKLWYSMKNFRSDFFVEAKKTWKSLDGIFQ
jgi:hypothetical protein